MTVLHVLIAVSSVAILKLFERLVYSGFDKRQPNSSSLWLP